MNHFSRELRKLRTPTPKRGTLSAAVLCTAACAAFGQPGSVSSDGTVKAGTTGGMTISGANYSILATAFDSRATPRSSVDLVAGAYGPTPFSTTTRVVTAYGDVYGASAKAHVNTFANYLIPGDYVRLYDGWDSGTSYAKVDPFSNPPDVAENARAGSTVNDPREYQLQPGETSAVFMIQFAAGSRVNSGDGSGGNGLAISSGYEDTDLLQPYLAEGGSLLNYRWAADSASAAASSFTFSSNPALGLDDAAITQAFLANVVGGAGSFTLVNDFTLEIEVGGLAEGTTYQFGGEMDYAAEIGRSVPAPGAILPLGGVLLACSGRRRR